jgi:hypothetical protein
METLEVTNSRESPARTTLSLILNGTNGTLFSPIESSGGASRKISQEGGCVFVLEVNWGDLKVKIGSSEFLGREIHELGDSKSVVEGTIGGDRHGLDLKIVGFELVVSGEVFLHGWVFLSVGLHVGLELLEDEGFFVAGDDSN